MKNILIVLFVLISCQAPVDGRVSEMADMYSSRYPDMTYKQAIDSAEYWIERNARMRFVLDSLSNVFHKQTKVFESFISVKVVSKEQVKSKYDGVKLGTKFVVDAINISNETVLGTKGEIQIKDVFDEEITSFPYLIETPLQPGQSVTLEVDISVNLYWFDYDERLYVLPFESMKFRVIPEKVVLGDGTIVFPPDNRVGYWASMIIRREYDN